ncbi:MAG: hypothetical protein R2865_15935 [Deinococcales bacterium]
MLIYLRTGLPKLKGDLSLAGLSAGVEVLRDKYAIPPYLCQKP